MNQKRKNINKKLEQLGRKLNMNSSDIAVAKITILTIFGTLTLSIFAVIIRRLLCSQLDPSGLWYLVPTEINSGFLGRFF